MFLNPTVAGAMPRQTTGQRKPFITALYAGRSAGYDSKDLCDWLNERGTQAVIPSRSNRKSPYAYDRTLYKQRNIIERCSVVSKTSAALRRALIAMCKISAPQSVSPLRSYGGFNESGS
jgi:hypothetical protein